ncbi:unnamed protein product [Microthlaspi erraticum]|uniref:Uncharacterized protein n=1 Tax=Microthlaspi erraticum TaxID=1685480 RepID=A0A6D2HWV9_9BRAS|nr:unnamed protein product [Microthlaspi erraticum]
MGNNSYRRSWVGGYEFKITVELDDVVDLVAVFEKQNISHMKLYFLTPLGIEVSAIDAPILEDLRPCKSLRKEGSYSVDESSLGVMDNKNVEFLSGCTLSLI